MTTELELIIPAQAKQAASELSVPESRAIVEEFQSMLQRARTWIIKKMEAM